MLTLRLSSQVCSRCACSVRMGMVCVVASQIKLQNDLMLTCTAFNTPVVSLLCVHVMCYTPRTLMRK